MKIIIAGGRTFNDYDLLSKSCDKAFSRLTDIEIVSGTANGADKYADALIAFWDGKSKGTGHMIDLAKKYELKVKVVIF